MRHQPTRHQPAQRPQSTGHQDRTLRIQTLHRTRHDTRGTRQTRHEQPATAHRHLRLTRSQHGRQQLQTALIHVGEDQSAGLLGLRGTDQAHERGRVQRAVRHDEDKAALRELRGGQPFLHRLQRARRRGVGLVEYLTGAAHDELLLADHHELRYGSSGVDRSAERGAERGEVGVGRLAQPDPLLVGDRLGRRDGLPGHPVQGLHGRCGNGELIAGDRPQGDRLDRRHRSAGAVGENETGRVLAGTGPADAQHRGTDRVQHEARERERQTDRAVVLRRGRGLQHERVQHRVEGGGVQAEARGFGVELLGQGDLGEEVVAGAPGGAQALEGRPVAVAQVVEAVVDAVQRDGGAIGRGPLVQGNARRGDGGREQAGRVGGPLLFAGPRVHGELTITARVGPVDGQPQLSARPLREDQGCLEGEFLDGGVTQLLGRGARELQEHRPRNQDRPTDRVISQPRMRGQRHRSRELHRITIRLRDHRSQQRVIHSRQTQTRRITGTRRIQPETLTLEGVRRQLHHTGTRQEPLPVHLHTVCVHSAQGGEQGTLLAAVLAQHRNHDDALGVGQALARQTRKRPIRTQLHERRHTKTGQRGDTVGETDRRTGLHSPVLGSELLDHLTGDIRNDRDPGSRIGQSPGDLGELRQHSVQMRGVESMAHLQPRRLHTLPASQLQDLEHCRLVTRNHRAGRAVEPSHAHTGTTLEPPGNTRLTRVQGNHRPTLGNTLHQTRPRTDQTRSILQRQHTRHMGRRQLTHRMTHQIIRSHPVMRQQTEQRHLDREQRRLSEHRPLKQLRLTLDHPGERTLQMDIQRPDNLIERSRKHRLRPIQLTSHPHTLTTLPGEQERHRTRRDGLARGQRPQSVQEFLAGLAHDHRAVVEASARYGQRTAHSHGVQLRPLLQERHQPIRLLRQSGPGLARHHPRHRTRHRQLLHRSFDLHGLLDDEVGVGTADAEGRDGRPARTVELRPLLGLRQQLHRAGRPVDVRGRLVHVQRRRENPVTHGHDHLDHARDTRRGLRVADVRLQRAESKRLFAGLAVGGQQRLRLDRVAELGARAVRLHRVHLGRRQAGVGQRGADDPLLRRPVRGRQTVARTILVHGGTTDHREHLVPVALRVRQPLQHQQTHTLGPARTVRRRGERLATPVRRQPALPGELHEHAGRGHDGHTTGDGHGGLALAQRLRGKVERDERGRAGGVNRHRRALKTEGVGQPARGHTGAVARQQVAVVAAGRLVQPRPVLLCRRAHIHTGAGAAQRGGVDARLLEGLPGRLQQQPLLGLHRRRLAGTDAEELGIEPVRIVQESTLGGVGLAGAVRIGGEERIKVPAPIGRESVDRVDLAADQTPQVLRRGDPSRQPACHAHDRDRLVKGCNRVHIVILALALVQAEELTTEVFGEYDRGRVVEKEAGGQRQPGGRIQRVPKLDGREGVEAQVLEGRVNVHVARRSMAKHGCHVRTHQLQLIASRHGPLRTAPPCRSGPDLDRPDHRTIQPEVLTLEGVGRQLHHTGTRQEPLPVHLHTVCVHSAQGGEQGTLLATVLAQHRNHHDALGVGQALARQTRKRPIRTQLHERRHTKTGQRGDTVGETDRRTGLHSPVLGSELLDHLTGDIRNDRDPGSRIGQSPGDLGELRQHPVQMRGVESMTHLQPRRLHTLPASQLQDLEHCRLVTRNHRAGRAVEPSHTHTRTTLEPPGNTRLTRVQGNHRPTLGNTLHQTRPRTDQTRSILQRQHTRHMRRRQLTHRMTHQIIRSHPVMRQQTEQRHLHREQRRLSEHRPLKQLRPTLDHPGERTLQMDIQRPDNLIERSRKHRLRPIQLTTHTHTLTTLPGEQERHRTTRDRTARHHTSRGHTRSQRPNTRQQLLTGLAHGHRAVIETSTRHRKRTAHRHDVQLRPLLQERHQPIRLTGHSLSRLTRHHPRHRPRHRQLLRRRRLGAPVRQHDVAVRTAHTERADTCVERLVRPRPWLDASLYGELELVERNSWVGGFEVQARHELAVTDAERRFQQADDAGSTLKVSDVGLHRSDPQLGTVHAAVTEHRAQSRRLDRVAQLGTRAVQFDVLHLLRGHLGTLVRLSQDILLAGRTRYGETLGRPVVVHRAAVQHAVDRVTVRYGGVQRLEHHERAALTAYISVRPRVESEAETVW
ncbi:hypothetical protein P3T34_004754 [Kitasatospora sp. MAP12-44]|nr:hypothetical protein [Kitasatospora sp. MAP12-44]